MFITFDFQRTIDLISFPVDQKPYSNNENVENIENRLRLPKTIFLDTLYYSVTIFRHEEVRCEIVENLVRSAKDTENKLLEKTTVGFFSLIFR